MFLLEHTCDIKRNAAVGTNGRTQMSNLSAGVSSLFLPMTARAAVENGFSVTRAYDVYFEDGQDVKVGDKLLRDGVSYYVRAVQPFTGLAYVSHIHVMAEQQVSS